MPILRPDDALPLETRRILVAGTSGAGKTTLAARVGSTLGVPHVELDGLFHGPSWTPRPSFVEDVAAFCAQDAWVTEWQYRAVRRMLARRADLVLWLDLPRATVMRQVSLRTISRRLQHEELWNGNVEPPLRTMLTDPDHVVRWAWRTHSTTRARIAELLDLQPDLAVVRLRNRREIDALLGALRVSGRGSA
ncbi:AAA family ATPase [Oerskovia flava]|uniref:AAA family ATPase n=1 Tax=Oerskovia flava TaxID=2986422 RepID=UPI00223F7F27|nr:AAA family ATPase [Oerskovia sp. JB1-3-2]